MFTCDLNNDSHRIPCWGFKLNLHMLGERTLQLDLGMAQTPMLISSPYHCIDPLKHFGSHLNVAIELPAVAV